MDRLFMPFETAEPAPKPHEEQEAARPLFEKVVHVMRQKGAAMLAPPSEWKDYGWFVNVQAGSAKVTCMLQRSDNWSLLITYKRRFLDRLRGGSFANDLKTVADLAASAVAQAFNLPLSIVLTEAELGAA